MKTLKTLALSLILMPATALAQKNVESIPELLDKDFSTSVVTSFSTEKDPKTGEKVSQCDIYNFTIPAAETEIVKRLEQAFVKDRDDAFSFGSGTRDKNNKPVSLAVGNDSRGVTVGSKPGMKYFYACFIAPEDTTGNHRYAYALEYMLDGGKFTGTFAVTYATTQSYRQKSALKILPDGKVTVYDADGGKVAITSAPSWFSIFSGYITSMTTADLTTRRALASKLYEHTKNTKAYKVDDRDKDTAREMLKSMLDDSRYNDTILTELLNGSLINIQ